jgi:hypothetical protein
MLSAFDGAALGRRTGWTSGSGVCKDGGGVGPVGV